MSTAGEDDAHAGELETSVLLHLEPQLVQPGHKRLGPEDALRSTNEPMTAWPNPRGGLRALPGTGRRAGARRV
ncbi:hypothetical protein [Micromonospora sp. RTP1Z1]|uniref:hypothetical protein n=1 Tax=Micromonospora sp. RTP1Z1 TaxID=2994043 RepID=UPI0039B4C609